MTDEEQQLEALEAKLQAVQEKRNARENGGEGAGMSSTRVGVELIAGIAAGGGLGYMIDRWFATFPIFFIIGFFLGVAAAGLNIYKLATRNTPNQE